MQYLNEVKRFQELAGVKKEQLDENAFKKGAAALGLAAALAGSPKVGMAQMKPTKAPQTAIDTAFGIYNLPDDKAGEELVYSYRNNPMSANEWAQGSEENKALLRSIKKVFNAARLGADYQSNEQGVLEAMVQELGKNYKKTTTAAEFMNRDEQDLTAQLREEDEATDPVAEKDAEQGLKQALATLKSGAMSIKPSAQDAQVKEAAGLALGLVAGAPGLISLLGKSVNAVAGLFKKDNKQGTTVGNALKHWGHKLEESYLEAIAAIIVKAFPKTYQGQDVHDHTTALYKTAHGVYAAILAAAAISSGLGAMDAHNTVSAGLEGGLSAFKSSEVVDLAQKIAAA